MNRRLRTALLGLIAVILAMMFTFFVDIGPKKPLTADQIPNDLDIFILAGQSNMSGRASVAALPSGFPAHGERLFVYSNAGLWQRATEPIDSAKGQKDPVSRDDRAGVGPGLSMAEALAQLNPGLKIGLVPCALSGSAMDRWTPAMGRDTLYGSCLARAKEAAAKGRIRALVWYQGESDTFSPALAEAWPKKFTTMVQALRRDLGQPDLVVIYTQLATVSPGIKTRTPGWDQLKALQATMRLDHAAMVKSGDLTHFDGIHLDTASQLTLGRRYALKLQEMLYPER